MKPRQFLILCSFMCMYFAEPCESRALTILETKVADAQKQTPHAVPETTHTTHQVTLDSPQTIEPVKERQIPLFLRVIGYIAMGLFVLYVSSIDIGWIKQEICSIFRRR